MKFKKFINSIEENISVVILAVSLVVLMIQVVGRFVFSKSPSWSEELARYLFIWFSYLSACVCVLNRTHICIDILIKVWPKKIRPVMLMIGNVVFLVYCAIFTYHGAIYTQSLIASGQISLGLGLHMWVVYASVPVCHLVMAIRLIQSSVWMLKHPEEAFSDL